MFPRALTQGTQHPLTRSKSDRTIPAFGKRTHSVSDVLPSTEKNKGAISLPQFVAARTEGSNQELASLRIRKFTPSRPFAKSDVPSVPVREIRGAVLKPFLENRM